MNWKDQQAIIAVAGSVVAIVAPLVVRQYFIAGLVFIVASIFAIRAIRQRARARYAYHEIIHVLTITDPSGRIAVWEKATVVTPLRDGITEWVDEDLDSDGELEIVGTAPGRLARPNERGTRLEPLTLFDTPLPRGRRLHKKLIMRVYDAFMTSGSEFKWWIASGSDFQSLRLTIRLPEGRPCRGVPEVSYRQRSTAHRVQEGTVTIDGREVFFEIQRPRTGVQYTFRWTW